MFPFSSLLLLVEHVESRHAGFSALSVHIIVTNVTSIRPFVSWILLGGLSQHFLVKTHELFPTLVQPHNGRLLSIAENLR